MIKFIEEDGRLFKLLEYIGRVTKESLEVEIAGHTEVWSPPTKVVISDKFFRSAKCKACGKCCSGISRAFLPEEVDEQWRIEKGIIDQLSVSINGRDALPFWVYFNHSEKCDFLVNSRCSVHSNKPIQCSLTPMYFDKVKDRTRLTKRLPGRNWRVGCPMELKEFDYDEFLNWDLVMLKRLRRVAEYLNISSWLPEVIDYLDSNKEIFKTVIPDKQIVIYERKKDIGRIF